MFLTVYLFRKNKSLKYFCMACDQGLKELPELKILIKKLLTEVDALKNSTSQNLKKESDYEFVISDINERNRREANLICNNVTESDSNQSEARIVYDRDQGKYPFRMGKIYTKHHPTLPYGCWKVVIDIEKPEINKAEKICLVFNSEHLLKSNHSMCE
ncbi:uncharacterized protein LOC126905527 isoform X6 [Daktulosphaira vitifoliae]|uniref:uncharacterized protein LOC126905527 isoform X6 n=1 Tax=Daktulosphaira vitifoliae TaxID=58002 RepID=UPI0021AA6398|nr:uncharacterized protein LOC126905527 isoform X6 [Daktulosphaira vitifoliae]